MLPHLRFESWKLWQREVKEAFCWILAESKYKYCTCLLIFTGALTARSADLVQNDSNKIVRNSKSSKNKKAHSTKWLLICRTRASRVFSKSRFFKDVNLLSSCHLLERELSHDQETGPWSSNTYFLYIQHCQTHRRSGPNANSTSFLSRFRQIVCQISIRRKPVISFQSQNFKAWH